MIVTKVLRELKKAHLCVNNNNLVGIDNHMKTVVRMLSVDAPDVYEVNEMEEEQGLQLFCKHALRRDAPTGSKNIEAIQLEYQIGLEDRCFEPSEFRKLSKLRFLQLDCANLAGNFENLLPTLRWLRWKIPSLDCTATNLNVKDLLILDLSNSKMMTMKLKVLDLSYCKELTRTPDLSPFCNLERLNISNCERLQVIDPSIGKLKHLASLNMTDCRFVKELLEQLDINETLLELVIDGTGIKKLPTLDGLMKLETLSANNCACLTQIPSCKSIEKLPDLSNLKSLQNLNACGCEKLQGLDGLDKLGALTRLSISGCKSIERLPDLSNLKSLQHLVAYGCEKLQGLDGLDKLGALTWLSIGGCKSIERLPDLSNLKSLQDLGAYGCEKLQGLDGLDKLGALTWLSIGGCKSIERLPDLSNLKSLQDLDAHGCEKLQGLDGLDKLGALTRLSISGCKSIEKLPNLSNLRLLEIFRADGCEKLQEVEGLKKVEEPPTQPKWKLWQCLDGNGIEKLQELDGLDELRSFWGWFEDRTSEKLLNQSNYGVLRQWYADGCEKEQKFLIGLILMVPVYAVESMGIAAIVHLHVFPAAPYKRGERCVRNVAVMSDYASLGTPPDPEEVRDCERTTRIRLSRHDEREKRLNFPQSVRDVVVGSGEIIVDDMKYTVSHVVEPVEKGFAKINKTFHQISENVKKFEERRKSSKDDTYLIPLNSWNGEFSEAHDKLLEGSVSDSGLSSGKRQAGHSKASVSRWKLYIRDLMTLQLVLSSVRSHELWRGFAIRQNELCLNTLWFLEKDTRL
ncbi:hypothetical protein CDL15_Pgr027867 [Punica granatum]|uniref:Uncharacterized protein n=1 Tax=Punica granatum TaxID=22663 RepID=A0A218XJY3_PUNGR|nr:hypothetical protein CDL15_Pgr027867 [Punica granatum]